MIIPLAVLSLGYLLDKDGTEFWGSWKLLHENSCNR